MYLGEKKIGGTLTFTCNTHTPSTGAAVDADAVPAYEIYEDETGTAVASGNMALLNDAGTTGFYSESITLAAATYEAGKSYTIRITGVVGGVTGVELHSFTVAARATDDLAYPTTSGRSIDVDADGGVEVDSLQTAALAAIAAAVEGAGSGVTAKTYTLTDLSTSLPIADASVWVTTDAAGANVVASGVTDTNGRVIFYLDSGTTYYIWRRKVGYDFTNPDTEVA